MSFRGPEGCGRQTQLYACIGKQNSNEDRNFYHGVSVLELRYPVPHKYPTVTQVPNVGGILMFFKVTGVKIPYSFRWLSEDKI